MENKEIPELPVEKKSLRRSSTINSLSDTSQSKANSSPRNKKLIFGILAILAMAISAAVYFGIHYSKNEKTEINEYQETQYSLDINTTITTYLGEKYTTSHSQSSITIFGLGIEGNIYNLMIVDGALTGETNTSSLSSVPKNIFMSFKVSKSGEILQSNYYKTVISSEDSNFLSGVIKAFVVDQDSEFEVESNCKKTAKGSTECTKNSKVKEGKTTMFKKHLNKNEESGMNQEKYGYTTKTWIKHGKIEKSSIDGAFSKKIEIGASDTEIKFHMKADIKIISTSNISKEKLYILNEINSQLPEVETEEYVDKKIIFNQVYDEKNEKIDSDLPPSVLDDSLVGRQLNQIDENRRSLIDTNINEFFLSLFEVPLNLTTRILTGYDRYYQWWYCPTHILQFGPIVIPLISVNPCISSNKVPVSPLRSLPSWSKNTTVNAIIATFQLSIFKISMSASVRVETTPYVQSYLNINGNTVTKFPIYTKITMNITGNATNGLAKVGAQVSCLVNSNITDYMTGFNSPFSAQLFLDKSFSGSVYLFFQFVSNPKQCYDFLGASICVKNLTNADKIQTGSGPIPYRYYPETRIFYSPF